MNHLSIKEISLHDEKDVERFGPLATTVKNAKKIIFILCAYLPFCISSFFPTTYYSYFNFI